MQLRKLAATLAWMAAMGAAAAAAPSSIVLQGGFGQSVTFQGEGAGSTGLGLQLGSCGANNQCALFGMAQGDGALASMGVFAVTSLVQSLQPAADGAGGFTASASSAPEFALFGFAPGGNGLLLAGDLNLLGLGPVTEVGGESEATLTSTLAVSGGWLAPALAGATTGLQLQLSWPGAVSLAGLVGGQAGLTAEVVEGSIGTISATPEPAAGVLLALGALALALARRRRGLGQAQALHG